VPTADVVISIYKLQNLLNTVLCFSEHISFKSVSLIVSCYTLETMLL